MANSYYTKQRTISAVNSTPWTGRDVAFGLIWAVVLTGVIIFVINILLLSLSLSRGSLVWGSLVGALISEMALLAVAWHFSVRKYRRPWSALGYSPPRMLPLLWVVPVLGAGLLFNIIYVVLVNLAGLKTLLPPPLPPVFSEDGANLALGVFLAVGVSPLAEETFFRGFVFAGLRGRFGLIGGAMLSALAFALAHLQIGVLVPVFLLGLLLAWLYYRTGSLWSCILVHLAYNGLALRLVLG